MSVSVRTRVSVPLSGADDTHVEFISFNGFNEQHIALVFRPKNQLLSSPPPLVRIHSECLTGDVFGSLLCDCGPQLNEAKQRMALEGGILIYLRQEGRGIGLYAKLQAYELQQQGMDTFEANRALNFADDQRDFEPAAAILKALELKHIRLLTNNPDKVTQLTEQHINIDEVLPTGVYLTAHNQHYLDAKAKQKAHTINLIKP